MRQDSTTKNNYDWNGSAQLLDVLTHQFTKALLARKRIAEGIESTKQEKSEQEKSEQEPKRQEKKPSKRQARKMRKQAGLNTPYSHDLELMKIAIDSASCNSLTEDSAKEISIPVDIIKNAEDGGYTAGLFSAVYSFAEAKNVTVNALELLGNVEEAASVEAIKYLVDEKKFSEEDKKKLQTSSNIFYKNVPSIKDFFKIANWLHFTELTSSNISTTSWLHALQKSMGSKEASTIENNGEIYNFLWRIMDGDKIKDYLTSPDKTDDDAIVLLIKILDYMGQASGNYSDALSYLAEQTGANYNVNSYFTKQLLKHADYTNNVKLLEAVEQSFESDKSFNSLSDPELKATIETIKSPNMIKFLEEKIGQMNLLSLIIKGIEFDSNHRYIKKLPEDFFLSRSSEALVYLDSSMRSGSLLIPVLNKIVNDRWSIYDPSSNSWPYMPNIAIFASHLSKNYHINFSDNRDLKTAITYELDKMMRDSNEKGEADKEAALNLFRDCLETGIVDVVEYPFSVKDKEIIKYLVKKNITIEDKPFNARWSSYRDSSTLLRRALTDLELTRFLIEDMRSKNDPIVIDSRLLRDAILIGGHNPNPEVIEYLLNNGAKASADHINRLVWQPYSDEVKSQILQLLMKDVDLTNITSEQANQIIYGTYTSDMDHSMLQLLLERKEIKSLITEEKIKELLTILPTSDANMLLKNNILMNLSNELRFKPKFTCVNSIFPTITASESSSISSANSISHTNSISYTNSPPKSATQTPRLNLTGESIGNSTIITTDSTGGYDRNKIILGAGIGIGAVVLCGLVTAMCCLYEKCIKRRRSAVEEQELDLDSEVQPSFTAIEERRGSRQAYHSI